jgi:GntR family transcriptional repressor for pyruvate dehydrogenase complex
MTGSDQVFDRLAVEIFNGRYAPGSSLPSERALVGVFSVNRHVVREALRRLEQAGLIKVSQGGSTRVLDFQRHAGLDVFAVMAEHASGADDTFWLALLEMRAVLATDVARLCALRGSQAVKDDILAIARTMAQTSDEHELYALEIRFWDRVNDGAGSMAYRLALNTMVRCSRAMGDASLRWSVFEVRSSGHRVAIATAIAAGNAARAEARTRAAMRAAVDTFERRMR